MPLFERPITLPPCGGGKGWGVAIESGSNHFDDAVAVFEDFVVPETQNPKSLPFHPRRPGDIGRVFGVLTTVHFDDETRVQTKEVDDVGPKRHLSPETATINLFSAQTRPQPGFGLGHIFAQVSCDANGHRPIITGAIPPPQPSPARGEGDNAGNPV